MRLRARGFTIVEAAISGVILLIGMMMTAQLLRTTFDSAAASSTASVASPRIVEQYMNAQVASLKALRTNPALPTVLAPLPLGTESIYADVSVRQVEAPTAGHAGGGTYDLAEYAVTVRPTVNGAPSTATMSFTRFWKLGVTNGRRPGI
ncbi:MAG TPA: hypothetical protein V6D00_04100 [Pantanalinema sp.]